MPHWESKQMKKSICLRILCSVVLCSVDAQRLGINVNNHCVTFLKRFAPIMVFLNVGICEVRSAPELLPAPWNEKVKYEILQASSSGIIPKPGDLVGVRFKGAYKGVVFEDIFNSEEPYIYRAGVGSILKGVDEAVLHMHTGEKLHLVFGGELAFGTKGRPSSPGKPRIPPNAIVDYEVELVTVPGADEEFILDEQ